MIKNMVRRIGGLLLMKYPKLRPYVIYIAKQFGLVIHTKTIRPIPILLSQSLRDLSPRAMQIYLQLTKQMHVKDKE